MSKSMGTVEVEYSTDSLDRDPDSTGKELRNAKQNAGFYVTQR